MADPFLSEIRIFSFANPPRSWTGCNGQILAINQNQALFALLGTTYGGNGQTTFALPDLRGRAPMHFGSGLGTHSLGESSGSEAVTLVTPHIPQHTHTVACNNSGSSQLSPANGFWGKEPNGNMPYAASASPNTFLGAAAIPPVGGNLPHNNMAPILVVNFCIALQGIFPSRN
jgi:microcystin-dependent protein